MNQLSIVTVVKNNLAALMSTYESVSILDFPHEWVVVDGGSDPETIAWINSIKSSQISYIQESDKNLYDAMNKGVRRANGSHLIFMNAGDRIFLSNEMTTVLRQLRLDAGWIGCIRKKVKNKSSKFVVVRPNRFAYWLIKYGIQPTSHQATIYPKGFLVYQPFNIYIGLAADQISIMNLLRKSKVEFGYSEIICDFEGGGLGDSQPRFAFFKQMFNYRNFQKSKLSSFIEILALPILLLIKAFFSLLYKSRILL